MIRLGAGTMEVEARDCSVCITLRGEFALQNVPELAHALETVVARRPRQVVLDVEHTSFIDARMLRLLVDLQQSVTSRGGTLTLRASHKVRRLLGVVGLSHICHFTDGCCRRRSGDFCDQRCDPRCRGPHACGRVAPRSRASGPASGSAPGTA